MGVRGLTKTAELERARDKIRVNSVHPALPHANDGALDRRGADRSDGGRLAMPRIGEFRRLRG